MIGFDHRGSFFAKIAEFNIIFGFFAINQKVSNFPAFPNGKHQEHAFFNRQRTITMVRFRGNPESSALADLRFGVCARHKRTKTEDYKYGETQQLQESFTASK